MPIYEYKCEKCDATFEKLQKGKGKVVCPSCGAAKTKKLFSVFASSSSSQSSSGGNSGHSSAQGSCGTGCCRMSGR